MRSHQPLRRQSYRDARNGWMTVGEAVNVLQIEGSKHGFPSLFVYSQLLIVSSYTYIFETPRVLFADRVLHNRDSFTCTS
jgi:hypothetical protein